MTVPASHRPDHAASAALVPDDLLAAPWYSTSEIAQVLQVTTETVRSWIRDGLPAISLAPRKGGYRVRRADLNAWLLRRYDAGELRDQRLGALARLDADCDVA